MWQGAGFAIHAHTGRAVNACDVVCFAFASTEDEHCAAFSAPNYGVIVTSNSHSVIHALAVCMGLPLAGAGNVSTPIVARRRHGPRKRIEMWKTLSGEK